jgi:hypothetical protein
MIEDHLDELRRKAARWLPLMDGNPESARLLRQWIEEDLDGLPAVSLMAVKMVTGALRDDTLPAGHEGTNRDEEVSNLASDGTAESLSGYTTKALS